MLIKNAVIFTAGKHNGKDFSTADLDAIVEHFNAHGLSGKVPIKFGHTDRASDEPAIGWVMKVVRDGDRVAADLDIGDAAAEKIKKGQYKFSSVELRFDTTDELGRTWRYALEGLAFLGASRPAVAGVSDLRALAASRQVAAGSDSDPLRMVVSSQDDATSEAELLRMELAASQRQMVEMALNNAVTSGRILPRDRELFFKHLPSGTLEDAQEWINTTPKPFRATRAATHADGGEDYTASDGADRALIDKTNAHIKRRWREDAVRLDFAAAASEVVRANPGLAREYVEMHGEEERR